MRRLAPTLVLAVIWALLVARIGPPGGDFAPKSAVGMGYVSPGYA